MNETAPGRILLIRFSSIGDIVLTTPLIRVLRQKFPESRIDFLTKASFAPLVQHHPALSNIIEFPNDGRLDALWKYREEIAGRHYDIILDLHRSFRSFALTFFQRARVPARMKKYIIQRFLLVKTGRNFYKQIEPIYKRYLDVAEKLNIQDDGLGTDLFYPANLDAKIREKLSAHFSSLDNIVAFAPGAGFATKRWPVAYFAETVSRLTAMGYDCIILGDNNDKLLAEKIVHDYPACVDFTGKLNLLESAAAIKQARKLITNDTGLLHIAEAVRTPVVAIFGSTVRELGFFPILPQSRVVENPDIRCRPCSHIGRSRCPRGHFDCMRTIAPELVFEEVLREV